MILQEQVPLAEYTTFHIGGPARFFVSVQTVEELIEALMYARAHELPWHVLAGGSNTLIADEGYDGLIIHLALTDFHIEDTQVHAQSACTLTPLIMETAKKGLRGWQGMYGIPGSIGGAVRGNAGAFGVEMQNVVASVEALHSETFEQKYFSSDICEFSYRNSFFKMHPEWIVLKVHIQLQQGSADEAIAKAEGILDERNSRQIQNIRSAGSFFMNPTVPDAVAQAFEKAKGVPARNGQVPAGWLIEESGCKGVCEGAACTGKRSANYFINTGSARAADIRALATRVEKAVQEKWDVDLEREVVQLGFL